MCDVLVLYILKRRDYYRDNKYLNVNDPIHDYEVITHKDTEEVWLELLIKRHDKPLA